MKTDTLYPENAAPSPIKAAIAKHKLTLTSSAPVGAVKDDWPCIQYQCSLLKDGKEIWSGQFSLGLGHVKWMAKNDSRAQWHVVGELTPDEQKVYNTLCNRPNSKQLPEFLPAHVSLAAKLAVKQKMTPELPDVLHSLLSDGSAYFDADTFEDWCSNYGYDTDSRKAEAIYKECDETGRKLARAFSAADLAELREAFYSY